MSETVPLSLLQAEALRSVWEARSRAESKLSLVLAEVFGTRVVVSLDFEARTATLKAEPPEGT